MLVWLNAASAQSYSVVVDAGSTGSRFHIFHADPSGVITSHTLGKVTPGLSSFVGADLGAGKAVMHQWDELLKAAASEFDAQVEGSIPLLVRATAGMRVFSQQEQRELYESIGTEFELQVADTMSARFTMSILTLSGDEEVYLGFLAANYLSKSSSSSRQLIGWVRQVAE
jgi:Golgi nucleoside diphosphatase